MLALVPGVRRVRRLSHQTLFMIEVLRDPLQQSAEQLLHTRRVRALADGVVHLPRDAKQLLVFLIDFGHENRMRPRPLE
jgi:hypothetical protein